MEKSRAIDLLDNLIGMIEDNQDNDYDTALRMAIEALKAQLSLEGTTSDQVSRTATIDVANNAFDRETLLTGFVRSIAVRAIRDMPSVQPERKKGEWSDGYRWQRCSLCKQTGKKSWNYCPNCGADMRGEQDEH